LKAETTAASFLPCRPTRPTTVSQTRQERAPFRKSPSSSARPIPRGPDHHVGAVFSPFFSFFFFSSSSPSPSMPRVSHPPCFGSRSSCPHPTSGKRQERDEVEQLLTILTTTVNERRNSKRRNKPLNSPSLRLVTIPWRTNQSENAPLMLVPWQRRGDPTSANVANAAAPRRGAHAVLSTLRRGQQTCRCRKFARTSTNSIALRTADGKSIRAIG